MFTPRLSKRTFLAALMLPFAVGAQTVSSASVDIRVVVPPVMQVLQDMHPLNLATGMPDNGVFSSTQRLVVFSNLKSGFCITLQQASIKIDKWSVEPTTTTNGVTLTSMASSGYLLCSKALGRQTIDLQHTFKLKTGTPLFSAFPWPISWSIASP